MELSSSTYSWRSTPPTHRKPPRSASRKRWCRARSTDHRVRLRDFVAAACIASAFVAPSGAAEPTPSRMIADESGLAALRAAAPPARRTFLDDLSGEAVALASGVLLQARVERADPSSDRFTGRVLSIFLGRPDRELRLGSRLLLFNETGYALPAASAPVLSLYRNDHVRAFATLITTAVGYVQGDTLVYRRRNGAEDRYSLRSSDNLFGCIQMGLVPRERCRVRQLAHYGVRSAAQLRLFDKIVRDDASVTTLWMLVRTHEPRAEFPTKTCPNREASGCASWAAFARRIHLVIPTD